MIFLLQDSKCDKGIDDAIIISKVLLPVQTFPMMGRRGLISWEYRWSLVNGLARYWTTGIFIFFTHSLSFFRYASKLFPIRELVMIFLQKVGEAKG